VQTAEYNENPEGSPQFRNHCRLAELGKEATRCENTQPVRVPKELTIGITKGVERNGTRAWVRGLPTRGRHRIWSSQECLCDWTCWRPLVPHSTRLDLTAKDVAEVASDFQRSRCPESPLCNTNTMLTIRRRGCRWSTVHRRGASGQRSLSTQSRGAVGKINCCPSTT
jgi:hypothetical protein